MLAGSNLNFAVGQTIPDNWQRGVHFVYSKNSLFSTGELVVVVRSNSSQTFGVVGSVHGNKSPVGSCCRERLCCSLKETKRKINHDFQCCT